MPFPASFGFADPRSLKDLHTYLLGMLRAHLWMQVMAGMVLGVLVGMAIGPSAGWLEPATGRALGDWLALPGKLFLTLIQMVVIPLVIASIIRGLAASENLEQLRRTGLGALLYFVATTAVAVAIGIVLATLIRPGSYIDSAGVQAAMAVAPPPPVSGALATGPLPERIVALLPSNPLNAMLTSNMLQVVVFSVIFGVALVMMPPKQARPLLDLLESLLEVCMTIVRWAMWLAPFAVFGLLAQLVAKLGVDALLGMGVYVATVLFGLLLVFIMHLTIVFVGARYSPLKFIKAAREVLLLAFSTSSCAAIMPYSIKVAEEKMGVRPSISQFVIPLAATTNMNGTALYQGVAALFLAQVFGVPLGLNEMLLIILVAVGATIGSPSVPGVGIVILAMVLNSVGVPAVGIALVMGVDRILDMSRTAVNAAGDLVACVLMERLQKKVAQPSAAATEV
jgi:Na+/H+-dicarboxylate symporter